MQYRRRARSLLRARARRLVLPPLDLGCKSQSSLLIIRILTLYVYGIQRYLHGPPFLVLRLLGLEAVFRLDRCGLRGGIVVELEFTLLRRCHGVLLLLYIIHSHGFERPSC
jgi:hypothetical protein